MRTGERDGSGGLSDPAAASTLHEMVGICCLVRKWRGRLADPFDIVKALDAAPLCRVACALIAGLVWSCSSTLAAPLQPLGSDLQTWIVRAVEDARRFPAFESNGIVFDEIFHATMTPEEADLAEAAIRDYPDHPRRMELAVERRRIASGGDVRRWTIWSIDERTWRICQETPFLSGTPYIDHGARSGIAWQLTNRDLSIVDLSQAPSGRAYGDNTGSIRMHLGHLLHGGLHFRPRSVPPVGDIKTDGVRWTAVMSDVTQSGAPIVAAFDGYWDAVHRRGFVERRVIVESPSSQEIGKSTRYSDWTFVPEVNLWIAGRVDHARPDGVVVESLVYRGVVASTPGEIVRLTQPPDPLGADPVRGPLALATFSDYRSDAMQVTRFQDGDSTVAPIQASIADERSRYRRIGWSIAAALAALLVLVKIRRRTAAS